MRKWSRKKTGTHSASCAINVKTISNKRAIARRKSLTMAFYMQFAVGADNEQIATNKYDMKIARRYRKALDFKRNRVLLGGDGENRTPVRKHFNRNFSGRRRSFAFPRPCADRHAHGLGSFIIHGALKALRAHVHH